MTPMSATRHQKLRGQWGEDGGAGFDLFPFLVSLVKNPLGEPLRRLCGMTLECNTQRAFIFLVSLFEDLVDLVPFDSDYSGEGDASLSFFLRSVLFPCGVLVVIASRILLTFNLLWAIHVYLLETRVGLFVINR